MVVTSRDVHPTLKPVAPRTGSRLTELDGLRAVAIIRVIVWHVTGWSAVTWVISAVPAMFFVTGSLLARSFRSRATVDVVVDRLRRLVPPMWFYGVGVYIASRYAGVSTSGLWTFLFPIVSPQSDLGGGWFTSALWYLRAYLWVLLLSPILWWLSRRFGSWAVGASAIVLLILSSVDDMPGSRWWDLGDVVLYGTCALAGMTWLSDAIPPRRTLLTWTLVSGSLAGVWLAVRHPVEWVVNNDHVLHLLVGAMWASALLSLPVLLSQFSRSWPATFVNSRPLTVYLWHSGVAWTMWQLLPGRLNGATAAVIVLCLTLACLPVVMEVVGLAERRDRDWLSSMSIARRISIVAAALLLVNIPAVERRLDVYSAPGDQPLPPSAAPKVVRVPLDGEVRQFSSTASAATTWADREAEMQRVLESFDARMKLGGTRAIVVSPDGRTWKGMTDAAVDWDQPSLIGSLTKTLTTTIVMGLVERGTVRLDNEVGGLGVGFRHGGITIRQLLTHTSGIPPFDRKSGLMADGTTPRDVVRWASRQRLRFKPGTRVEYSTTGYVLIGVYIEMVTGRSFEDLVTTEIERRYGYDLDYFRGRYSSVGFSTGGIIMKMGDLADWIHRYVWDRSVTTTPWEWEFRATTGIGVHGYCPCTRGSFTALGHMGGRTFATVDGDGYTVVIDTKGILVLENFLKTQSLAQSLRLIAGGGRTMVKP